MIVCTGRYSEPHPETVVIGRLSARLGAWIYDCPKCHYDVRVPIERRGDLAETGRTDLHRLAVTMSDLKAGRR